MRPIRHTCVLVFLLLAASVAVAQARWVTSKPVVNMYSSASEDVDVVSQVIYGVTIQQIAATDSKTQVPAGWMQIKTPDDYTGWVKEENFFRLTARQDYAGEDKRVVIVYTRAANLYREPDVTEHAPVLTLPFESSLEVVAISEKQPDRWLKVKLTNGSEAWVQRGDVQDRTSKKLIIDEVVSLAKQFLGVTYTWGGTTSFGFDCSGYTQMLMRQRGIFMPRDADIQAQWNGLVTVSKENLKPGDLIFFGTEKSITHTGMYIGAGEFIHDTTHDKPMVQISRLADPYWTELFVIAKRAK